MEFLTPKQKKEKARRLYIGYGLFAVLISLASYILISTALGYEIFSTKGEVIQNGLLFVDSKPSNADIFVNGKKESSATNAKLSLPEGVYNLSLKKSGYIEWRDKVVLSGGNVKILDTPRLLPVSPLRLADIPMPRSPTLSLMSKDNRWLVVSQPELGKFAEVYDIDNPNTPPLPLVVPESLLVGQKAKVIELLEWASDNHHLLIRALIGVKQTYLLIDKDNPSDVSDLTQIFSLNDTDTVGFWDYKYDKLYIHHSAGTVELANLKDRTIASTPLIGEPVLSMFVLPNERAVFTVSSSDTDLSLKLLANTKTYIFSTVKKSDNRLVIKSASYNRNEYIAIGGGSIEKTLIYRNLSSLIGKTTDTRIAPFVLLPSHANYLEFSRLNRFILGTDGTTNSVYDIEAKEVLKYPAPAKYPSITGWFDDSRLYSLGSDQTLKLYDFGGSNILQLASSSTSIPVVNNDITHTAFFVPSVSSQSLRFIDIASASSSN